MTIGIFIADIEFRTGGSESYFAGLLAALQKLYGHAEFEVLTTCTPKNQRLDEHTLAERLSKTYGAPVHSRFRIVRIPIKMTGAVAILLAYKWLNRYSAKFDIFLNCSRNLMTFKAKKNVSVMHFPMQSWTSTRIARRMPFLRPIARLLDQKWRENFDVFLCNSRYTEKHLKKIWDIPERKIIVVYPPVRMIGETLVEKKRQIMVCSRIEPSKSLHILVKAFESLRMSGVKLVVAGARLHEDEAYYQDILKIAGDSDVTFCLNPSRNELEALYRESIIFWHAKGFETEEDAHPDLLEHFGITTVEAMSAGCIPVVIDKGGQQEIVDEGRNGFKWKTVDELLEKTRTVLELDDVLPLRNAAEEKAHSYGFDSFYEEIKNIFGGNYEN